MKQTVAGSLAEIRFALTTWPTGLEALLAAGLASPANNLDWWGAEWQNRAFFEALASPWCTCTATTPMSTATLAIGLAGKEPGQTAVSVDALVEGLASAAAVEGAADDVRRLVEGALSGDPALAAKDLGALLELLVHLRSGCVDPLPTSTRRYLEGLGAGGKIARDKKLLLA